MDPLLQEITMLPGVLGCFVFNAKQRVICSKMPPIFKENSLQTIGSLITRTMQIGSMAMLNPKEIEMKYNESLLMIKPLPKESLLILICEPGANKSLINMTTGMLTKDIAKVLAQAVVSQSVGSQSIQRPVTQLKQATETQTDLSKEAEINAELASSLEKVKNALAMAIGPIAGPVMKDAIEVWAQQSPPSISSVPNLTKLLCTEINDKDLEQTFKANITRLFSQQ